MAEEIVGSHLKSQRGRGQNQDQTGSSTREASLAPIPNVSVPNAKPVNTNAHDDEKRLAEIMGHPIKAHDRMPPRAVDNGSPGGKVPAANVRRSKTDNVGRPLK